MSYSIITGDCRTIMAAMEPDSVDAIVTDPPYGLGFMGKDWDIAVPGPEFWTAALRVAKPGAHLLAFGGTRLWHRLAVAIEEAGWEIRDTVMWLYGTGFPKSLDVSKATKDALWSGWGTALKPAWEPVIVARKPLIGTVAANVLAHGTGGVNVDGCRIGTDDGYTQNRVTQGINSARTSYVLRRARRTFEPSQSGRWPANLILDEHTAAILDAQSGTLKSGARTGQPRRNGVFMPDGATIAGGFCAASEGGASRFFYVAKPSRAERNNGGPNRHPTVKPIALMRHLVRLVTPPGGLVLDPFTGSGTTGCAARLEGFRFVGCEMDLGHAELARSRIAAVESEPVAAEPEQADLFEGVA